MKRSRAALVALASFMVGYWSSTIITQFNSAAVGPPQPRSTPAARPRTQQLGSPSTGTVSKRKLLAAIVSFDLQQSVYLQQQLDSFRDICESGLYDVQVVVYTATVFNVSLLALMTELTQCYSGHLGIEVIVKSPATALHLVDYHRALFYERLHQYDLFLYTEDDIRIGLSQLVAFVSETQRLKDSCSRGKFADYSLGFVRYEHDLPYSGVDDANRKKTSDSTRVYWEHNKRPLEKNFAIVRGDPELPDAEYVTMSNHHQGFYLATKEQLALWKIRCQFDVATNRPGTGNQPKHGTQRVWMSSLMLFHKKHCNVKQVIPVSKFSLFSVHHLANKNYKRIGKRGRLQGAGEGGAQWVRAEEVRNWLQTEQATHGLPLISMVDEIDPLMYASENFLKGAKLGFAEYREATDRSGIADGVV